MIDEEDRHTAPALPAYDELESSGAAATLPLRSATSAQGTAPSTPPRTHGATQPTLSSPAEAVRFGQTVRTRFLAWGVFGLCAAALATVPVLAHDTTGRVLLGSSLLVSMGASVWIWKVLGDASHVTDRRIAPPWIVLTLACGAMNAGFGVFSPAPLMLLLAVYFVTQRHGLLVSVSVYALGGSIHALLVLAIAAGVLEDPGIVTASALGPGRMLLAELLVQLLLAGAFWVSRVSYVATTAIIQELQLAAHVSAQREALLMEAREELERAMQLGGPGRFTDQVLGSFRLGAVLGRGAMGEVYEAKRVSGGDPAAVKLLRRDALANPGTVARFLREAVATAALDSPHVVRVLETGDETAPLPYIAMERLVGNDLAYHLRARPCLPTGELVELIRQVARGVDAAHKAGIVHRDLKPQNLFLHQPDPPAPRTWKILDFGVATLRNHGGTITQGHVVGTPAYMAPEQVRGHAVDGRTDVYALGVVAFRTLTGELPYRGRDTPEILYNVVHAPMPEASGRVPGVPSAVDEVLLRAMARDPRDRFATAGAFAAALAAALGA